MISPRTDELLRGVTWPQIKEATPFIGDKDTLITCAGFEDRALEFLARCVRAGSKSFRLIGVKYLPEVPENRVGQFEELSDLAGAEATLQTYIRQEPDNIDGLLSDIKHAARLWVDISGMSKLLIVQLISAGVRQDLLDKMEVVYSEAEIYPPSKEAFAEKLAENKDYRGILNFISSGVYGITIVPELSTVAMQGQPVRLLAFPSFNPTQFAAVTSEIQALALTIINGVPPRDANLWRREAIRQLNGIDSIREKEEFDTSTLDYRDTLKLLLELYAKYGASQKIIVSPTGSKMQSVAIGLACGFLRDLQIVYPTPKSFPTPSNYTTGVSNIYQLSLATFAGVVPPSHLAEVASPNRSGGTL
jgi:hypothetical protein